VRDFFTAVLKYYLSIEPAHLCTHNFQKHVVSRPLKQRLGAVSVKALHERKKSHQKMREMQKCLVYGENKHQGFDIIDITGFVAEHIFRSPRRVRNHLPRIGD